MQYFDYKSVYYGDDELDEELLLKVRNSKVFDGTNEFYRRVLSRQLLESVWLMPDEFDNSREARLAALELWASLDPRDAFEALLTKQIILADNAATRCYAATRLKRLTPEQRDRLEARALQYMSMVERLIARIDKHRGAGQQRIRVERVTLIEGDAQALVSDVQAPSLPAANPSSLPPPAAVIGPDPSATPLSHIRSRTRPAR